MAAGLETPRKYCGGVVAACSGLENPKEIPQNPTEYGGGVVAVWWRRLGFRV